MKVFAFIFARGGSKGLPRKNIKLLAGKPLIQYSIETAQKTNIINEIFVSTDDDEIAKIASSLGAIVIRRPTELSQDTSPEWLAWRHAAEWATQHYGQFDLFISLPATSPLRSVFDVEASVDLLTIARADICISITAANRNPYFNMVTKNSQEHVRLMMNVDEKVVRRQDAPAAYDITTVVYTTTPGFILNKNSIFEGDVCAVEVPKERAVDIDDIYDFKLSLIHI